MAQISIERFSYVPGDIIQLVLVMTPEEFPDFEITNVSLDFHRCDVARNTWVFGSGVTAEQVGDLLTVKVNVPDVPPGLYLVTNAILTGGQEVNVSARSALRYDPPIFEIRADKAAPSSRSELEAAIRKLCDERDAYAGKVHATLKARQIAEPRVFAVLVLATGTNVHTAHQLEGYRIVPLPGGMSHQQLLDLANSYMLMHEVDPLPLVDEIERRFVSGTPSFVIDYASIEATDHEDALLYCREHADLVYLALGRDRGQVPREFGFVIMEEKSGRRWHGFHAPWYRGNLIQGFGSDEVARSVETMLPKLLADPFARLLSRTYVEATVETTAPFKIFRLWTMLELAADRAIPTNNTALQHPDGTPILKLKGTPETNESKVGRVFSYLISKDPPTSVSTDATGKVVIIGDSSNPNFAPGAAVYSIWDMVKAAYAVRNFVAHEGAFDPKKAAAGDQYEQLAAKALTTGEPPLVDFVTHAAQCVLWREA